jgi:uncharacterized integral membrane protein (TIGR00697 family)
MSNKRSVWAIVALVGTYILCQAVADIGATRLVEVAGIVIPAGTFIFAVTFTLRDLLHKRLGKEWARAAIVVAGCLNVVQAAYLAFIGGLPTPAFYPFGETWSAIFAIVPAVTIASIIAEVVCQLVDTEIWAFWRQRLDSLPQWTAVLASNLVSLPLDSFIFGTLAFVVLPRVVGGDALPFGVAMSLVGGQIVFKAIVTAISLPTIYLVKER